MATIIISNTQSKGHLSLNLLHCVYFQLMCSKEDLKELGLGMGPRKKLSSFISQENERQEAAKERRARETAERLEQERREAKEAVDAAVTAARLFGVKILKGVAGTGQTYVEYPQLLFQPQQLFAIGSPIGLFLTVRYVAQLVRYIRCSSLSRSETLHLTLHLATLLTIIK